MDEPSSQPSRQPSDDQLLTAVDRLWQQLDPPPADLVDGVLARLAAEELDYELLTLVEGAEPAGVRSVSAEPRPDEHGTWSLEYSGPGFRVFVRVSRSGEVARVDGWVVPARPLTVRISTESPYRILQQAAVDEHGRFELVGAPTGLCRLVFLEEPRTGERPQATPPFWI